MTKTTDFIKSIVRPVLIIWGFIVAGVVIMGGGEIPVLWLSLIGAFGAEYGIERAVKRFKGQ